MLAPRQHSACATTLLLPRHRFSWFNEMCCTEKLGTRSRLSHANGSSPAVPNIGGWCPRCGPRVACSAAGRQPLLDFVQVPHHALRCQVEPLRKFTTPLHFVDCGVCKGHDLSKFAATDSTLAKSLVLDCDGRCIGTHGRCPPVEWRRPWRSLGVRRV